MKQLTYKQLVFEIGHVEHKIYYLDLEKEELEMYLSQLKQMLDNGNYKEDKNEQN